MPAGSAAAFDKQIARHDGPMAADAVEGLQRHPPSQPGLRRGKWDVGKWDMWDSLP